MVNVIELFFLYYCCYRKISWTVYIYGTIWTTLHCLCNLQIAQKVSLSYYSRLERLVGDIYSSLLGPFVNFEEKEVLSIYMRLYGQHFIYLVTYKFAQYARLSYYTQLERLAGD
jgi:hypothetical protein